MIYQRAARQACIRCVYAQGLALTTTACIAIHRGSAHRRWHTAPSYRHILVSVRVHVLWQNDARSCDAPWPHSLQRDMRGEKRPLVSSLFSPTRRPPDAAPATAVRDVLAPVPEFTRKPAALRLRLSAATHEWVRRCNLLEGLLALFAHHRGTKDPFVCATRTHHHHVRALLAARDLSTMSIVHLQNVEIINSEARFSGACTC